MPSFDNADDLKSLISLLAPGLIILWVRSRFMIPQTRSVSDDIISYLIVSSAYYAIVSPILTYCRTSLGLLLWSSDFLEYAILPFSIGLCFAVFTQKDLGRPLAKFLNLRPIHHTPPAWDWAFDRVSEGAYILVTFHDGARVAGAFGEESFASSTSAERDVYIGEIYDISDTGEWAKRSEKTGILIKQDQIRYVEFFEGA